MQIKSLYGFRNCQSRLGVTTCAARASRSPDCQPMFQPPSASSTTPVISLHPGRPADTPASDPGPEQFDGVATAYNCQILLGQQCDAIRTLRSRRMQPLGTDPPRLRAISTRCGVDVADGQAELGDRLGMHFDESTRTDLDA